MVTGAGGRHITSLWLPGIGWWLQWRSDDRWRDLPDVQYRDERAGVHVPVEDEWAPWTGHPQPQVRAGERDGTPAWSLLHGELPTLGDVTVVLADGTRPAVRTVGKVWGCEWHGLPQPATVHHGGVRIDLPVARPQRRWMRP